MDNTTTDISLKDSLWYMYFLLCFPPTGLEFLESPKVFGESKCPFAGTPGRICNNGNRGNGEVQRDDNPMACPRGYQSVHGRCTGWL